MSSDQPPTPASFINNIDLTSVSDSRIVSVSVYPGRAEVTRVLRISIKPGQNQVTINGLPNVIDTDSLRIEGRGPATINDVTIGNMPDIPKPATSPALDSLVELRERTLKAQERYKRMHGALEKYLSTMNMQHTPPVQVKAALETYAESSGQLEETIMKLDKELIEIGKLIQKEQKANNPEPENVIPFPPGAQQDRKRFLLRMKVSINVFADKEGEIEFVLVYAVKSANWDATYDVRVNTQEEGKPISLIYKASIVQSTGEDWTDVPLTLETAKATYETGMPSLRPWILTTDRFNQQAQSFGAANPFASATGSFGGSMGPKPPQPPGSAPIFQQLQPPMAPPHPPLPPMAVRTAMVSSKGNVSATFDVPGNITIPSDGAAHKVTIVDLKLAAKLAWIAVPKLDPRARISARIQNASEYTLIGGTGSVYVDGSFISKAIIPAVSPEESFHCPLGLDPAVRVTYHQMSKKTTQAGILARSTTHLYSQRISVHNTKSAAINLRIIDQIPTSEDQSVVVKLISPALSLPTIPTSVTKVDEKAKASNGGGSVQISSGITAQWGDGTEDRDSREDTTATVGRDGNLHWLCELSPQRRANLLLKWEVTTPTNLVVSGL